jgi:hypothetical protein
MKKPDRVLIVCDAEGQWYVRRVAAVTDMAGGSRSYRCDEDLGGPFPSLEKAAAHLRQRDRDPNWPAVAKAAVAAVARRLPQLTTDDVWAELAEQGASGGDPRAIGPVMDAAAADGTIERTEETVKSSRKECHGRPVRIWASLVCKKK